LRFKHNELPAPVDDGSFVDCHELKSYHSFLSERSDHNPRRL
jgi:hypothetical protein